MNERSPRFPSELTLVPGDGVGYALGFALIALVIGGVFAGTAVLIGTGSNIQIFNDPSMSPTDSVVGAGYIGVFCLFVAGFLGWYFASGWRTHHLEWHTATIGGTEYPLSDPHNASLALALAVEPDTGVSARAGNPNAPAVVFSRPQLTRAGNQVTVGPGTSVVAVSDEVAGGDRVAILAWLQRFAA